MNQPSSLKTKKLSFIHFPGFAKFLLDSKLKDIVSEQLRLSREVNIPLLKLLNRIPEQQLIELSKQSMTEMLSYAIKNKLEEEIQLGLSKWKDNMLPFMTRELVVVDDIILASYIRKKSMLHFLPEYTSNITTTLSLINEIDEYVAEMEAASFKIFMDIQNEALERKNEELRRSETRFQRMVEEVQDYAIIRMSKEGIIENWNRGAEKIKGYKAEEIVGKNFSVFYTSEDLKNNLPEKLLEEAAETGRVMNEGWRVRKDGTRFWSSTVITALHDNKNEVIGYTKVTRDLREIKEAQDELREYSTILERQKQKLSELNISLEEKNKDLERSNKELASFSYVASHDLQEPLRKIMIFTNLVAEKESAKLSEDSKMLFNKIISSSQRMKNLIEDLLSFSRIQNFSQEPEPVDLNQIVNDIRISMEEGSQKQPVTIHAEKLPVIIGISFQLRQLFENIIGNAVKYAKPDLAPVIEITCKTISGRSTGIEGARADKYYKISLKDNGIGFEQKYAEKIFEVFQRLHSREEYSGTGIGLAICKKIVQSHGGFITAEGIPDEGATFMIYLPVPQ